MHYASSPVLSHARTPDSVGRTGTSGGGARKPFPFPFAWLLSLPPWLIACFNDHRSSSSSPTGSAAAKGSACCTTHAGPTTVRRP